MNIYEQIGVNRRKTWLLIGGFILIFLLFGFVADQSFGVWPFGTLIALGFATFTSYLTYKNGPAMVISSLGGQEIPLDDPRYPMLDNVVEEMAIAAGIPRPKLYLLPSPSPNALATGHDPRNAVIAVTQGLLDKLNREELQGVVAHEMAHIRNNDIQVMTVVAALAGALLILSNFFRNVRYYSGSGSSSRRGGGGGLFILIGLIFAVLAPLIADLIQFAVSRQREYLADASGAELSRNPLGLASALRKISQDTARNPLATEGVAHLFISDPDKKEFAGAFAGLFTTHPPIDDRISRLEEMGYVRSGSSKASPPGISQTGEWVEWKEQK